MRPSGVHVLIAAGMAVASLGMAATPEDREFFETRIRPVLAQDCYECHRSEGKKKGGLALDHRAALLAGGDSGPAVVPGKPEESLLITAIRHADEELKMPKKGAQLEAGVIADFVKWVSMGAPDPRETPPSEVEVAADTNWNAVMQRRKGWWSFQPLVTPEVPEAGESRHPVDRFIAAALQDAGLPAAGRADRRTLIRRLSFAVRGVPPTPEEVTAFVADPRDHAYEELVDAYLASPQFGERWARHWMDWLRYADSSGSEGDPMIPHAWRYRDYLIRALNADVPYDQLVREHLAGDLLEDPRVADGLNESALGTAHLRMVFHGFAPTDALDEQVRFTDDQINVLTKGFMGLTVSCARCHDHKFDAISQADFYALYGILASTKPGMIAVDVPGESEAAARERMAGLKAKIRKSVGAAWEEAAERVPGELQKLKAGAGRGEVAYLFQQAAGTNPPGKAVAEWKGLQAGLEAHRQREFPQRWEFGDGGDFENWAATGPGAGRRSEAGEFALALDGEKVIADLYPAGVYSHLLSTKDRGVLFSPWANLDGAYRLWVRAAGDGEAMVRPVVQNYPRNGTVYPVNTLKDGSWRWVQFGLEYWEGDRIHVEVTTAADQAVLAKTNVDRSWFGVREALLMKAGEAPPKEMPEFIEPILAELESAPASDRDGVGRAYETATRKAAGAWMQGAMTDGQAALLKALLDAGILPNRSADLPGAGPLLEAYRELEAGLAVPVRAPGVWEAPDVFDQPLFVRGDHKQPAEEVPRRFLEAIDGEPYRTTASGRRELAEDLVRPDNPFTSRVIVNRVWHHLFGRGLVATADNFGRLGEEPTHPELLDFLAARFREDGWSLKGLIRDLVLSETWQRASTPPNGAPEADPGNALLSHFRVRRLEAEAIRDSLLAVTGQLQGEMYGPPVTGGAPRRSVYMRIKRNNLDPFLAAFDAPVPSSTKGRRDVTNVPAQSLAMLNSVFVLGLADGFASRFQSEDEEARVSRMFERALGRLPTAEERDAAVRFVGRMAEQRRASADGRQRVAGELLEVNARMAAILDTARQRVTAGREGAVATGPAPVAHWDFEGSAEDRLGGLHAKLHGGAEIVDGALVVGKKNGYASTGPLKGDLRAKTLEAWVQLDNLGQKGGGVVTVQTVNGNVFDAIVFAEGAPRRWLAGSDHHKRTKSLAGPEEDAAAKKPVHVAITWGEDGTVTCYRDGTVYGTPYKSDGPVTFAAGESQVLFGNRHGKGAAGRLLAGKILEARLYDRALSAEEVAASAGGSADFVSENDLLAAMSDKERATRVALAAKADRLQESLGALPGASRPANEWADLAHALFNLKEFIYVR